MKHDGLVHEIDVPALELPTCEKCGEEHFDNRADEQINEALRAKLGLLTPAQIRRARKRLGLKQRELAERLKVAPATISRWESGSVIQSGAMDSYLRAYFAFPEVRAALIGNGQDPDLGVFQLNEENLGPRFGGLSPASSRDEPWGRVAPSFESISIDVHAGSIEIGADRCSAGSGVQPSRPRVRASRRLIDIDEALKSKEVTGEEPRMRVRISRRPLPWNIEAEEGPRS